MSVTLIFGLLLQLAALVIVLRRVRSRILMFNGAILVVMLCIFHGLPEIANVLYPGMNHNLVLVDQEAVDRWVLLVGFAILLFSVVYTWTLKRNRKSRFESRAQIQVSLPVLLSMAIPAFILVITSGLSNYYGTYGYWIGGLSHEFFLLLMVMCFVDLILLFPRRWTMFLLTVEILLFTIAGSRLYVIAVFIMTAGALARYGRPLKFRSLCIGFLLLATLTVLISSTRLYYGRETYLAPMGERLSNITRSAVTAMGDSESDIKGDFIYRFDGNIFPTIVNEKFREGYPGVGLRPFANNFLSLTPSFLYRGKVDSALEDREERWYTEIHFGMPLNYDLATTLFTVLFGYYGVTGLMFCAAGLGFVFAHLDRWVNSASTLLSLVTGLGLAYCCIITEQGVNVYFHTFRTAIVLLVVMLAASRFRLSAGKSQKSRSRSFLAGAHSRRSIGDEITG